MNGFSLLNLSFICASTGMCFCAHSICKCPFDASLGSLTFDIAFSPLLLLFGLLLFKIAMAAVVFGYSYVFNLWLAIVGAGVISCSI